MSQVPNPPGAGVSTRDEATLESVQSGPFPPASNTDEGLTVPETQPESESGRALRILGRVLMIVGSAPILAGILIGRMIKDLAFAYLSPESLLVFLVTVLPLGLAMTLVGRFCYKRGKKLVAAARAELILRDSRPPILYLRSFKDDSKTARTGSIGMLNWLLATATEEEQFAEAMGELGPFIAIGKPGDKLPQLGAARIYVSNEAWQERVGQLMSRALLVVLRAGDTPGFWWEVERAARSLRPEQLLFLLPLRKKKYEAFRQKMNSLLPHSLPEFRRTASVGSGLRGVLYFENGWVPCILAFKRPFFLRGMGKALMPFAQYVSAAKPLVSVFKSTLQPVLGSLHLRWQKPPVSSLRFYITVAAATFAFSLATTLLYGKMERDANAHYVRGDALFEKGDLDAAISEYRRAQRFDAESATSHLKLGSAFAKKADWDQSIAELDKAVRLSPASADAHLRFAGALLQKKGNADKALGEYRDAVRLDPELPDAHYMLGLLLLQNKDLDEAVPELRKAVRLKPDNTDVQAMLALASVTRAAKDLEESGDRVSQLLQVHPDIAVGHYAFALSLELTGNRKEALAEYRTAHDLDPSDTDTYEGYVRLSRELKH